MKATELMIGDWVYRKRSYDNELILCQIIAINRKGCTVEFDNGSSWSGECFEDIEPITLTPEILEKNGFKKEIDEDKIHNIYTLTENSTALAIVYARSVFQWFYPIDIKYVHELQHIMKLCEIKKEIIL